MSKFWASKYDEFLKVQQNQFDESPGVNRNFAGMENQMPAPSTIVYDDVFFREEFERRFPSLSYEFIQTMDEIGKLGRDKYGDNCIENRIKRGDLSRHMERIYRREIASHAANHFQEYIDGRRHDVYGTLRHQLAAASFNPMMEFMLSGSKKEGI